MLFTNSCGVKGLSAEMLCGDSRLSSIATCSEVVWLAPHRPPPGQISRCPWPPGWNRGGHDDRAEQRKSRPRKIVFGCDLKQQLVIQPSWKEDKRPAGQRKHL